MTIQKKVAVKDVISTFKLLTEDDFIDVSFSPEFPLRSVIDDACQQFNTIVQEYNDSHKGDDLMLFDAISEFTDRFTLSSSKDSVLRANMSFLFNINTFKKVSLYDVKNICFSMVEDRIVNTLTFYVFENVNNGRIVDNDFKERKMSKKERKRAQTRSCEFSMIDMRVES